MQSPVCWKPLPYCSGQDIEAKTNSAWSCLRQPSEAMFHEEFQVKQYLLVCSSVIHFVLLCLNGLAHKNNASLVKNGSSVKKRHLKKMMMTNSLVVHHEPKKKTRVDLSNLEHANMSFSPNPAYVVSANSIISHLGEVNLKFIGFLVLLVLEL